jgi:hypothetical protein
MVFPQAYHITFGVYMARPPGTSRPHVDKDHNQYGGELAPTHPELEDYVRRNAKESPVKLSLEQRKCVEAAITDLATRYKWVIHAQSENADHIHVVIAAPRPGDQLRDAVKAVATK